MLAWLMRGGEGREEVNIVPIISDPLEHYPNRFVPFQSELKLLCKMSATSLKFCIYIEFHVNVQFCDSVCDSIIVDL